jgi:hypothetical protein
VLVLHDADGVLQGPTVKVREGRSPVEIADHRKEDLLLLGHVGFDLVPKRAEDIAALQELGVLCAMSLQQAIQQVRQAGKLSPQIGVVLVQNMIDELRKWGLRPALLFFTHDPMILPPGARAFRCLTDLRSGRARAFRYLTDLRSRSSWSHGSAHRALTPRSVRQRNALTLREREGHRCPHGGPLHGPPCGEPRLCGWGSRGFRTVE